MKIYRAAAESIAAVSAGVDDSDGYFSDEFEFAVSEFTDIAAGLDLQEKKNAMEYLFDRYIRNDPDYYQEYYDNALRILAEGKQELLIWENLLKPYFEKIPQEGVEEINYQEHDILDSWLWIQDGLDRKEEVNKIYENYYHVSSMIFEKYLEKLIGAGEPEKAKDIAEEREPHLFPRAQIAAREFLVSYYKGKDWEKYYEKMEKLFKSSSGWNYYDEMKKSLPREIWDKKLPDLIEYMKKNSHYTTLIDLYIRENRKTEALETLLKQSWTEPLAKYLKTLGDVNPGLYFEAFRKAIEPRTKDASSRGHYRNVAAWLKKMKTLKGQERKFRDFLDEIKRNNTRRPAFLEELKGI